MSESEPDRFTDLPTPDRFFLSIGGAEVDMRPMEHDDVRFTAQNVPGGRFGLELAAAYSYAGYDCKQHVTFDVDGAVELRNTIDAAIESRGIDPETGERHA